MRTSILTVIVISLLTVFWIETAGALHNLFKEMDKNQDGVIERGEFYEDIKKDTFNKTDTNKDEAISPEEWNTMEGIENKQEVFRSVDKNADKRISFPEFSNYADKYSNIIEAFMVMDKNKDGALAPDEVSVRPLFRWIIIRY
ncbi:MAG: EF-hand domain-containing protein [Nitrospirae bacterium]|nr:EF-hand domain-containing protein [Nitrospirota bacterium]